MKIAIVTDQYWPCVSGVSVSIDSFRSEMETMGHEVHILAPGYEDGGMDADAVLDGVHRFRSRKVLFNDENRLVRRSERKSVHRLLDALAPDIVHVQTEFTLASMAVSWARGNNVPLVISAHTNWADLIHIYLPMIPYGIAQQLCHWKMFLAFRRADAIVVPTALMDTLISSYWIRKPVRIIPTGIRDDHFIFRSEELEPMQKSILEAHPQLRGCRFVLYVGRLGTEKDIPFLFEVLARLLPRHPDLKLVVVGEGPARREIEDRVVSMGLERNVVMVGFIPHDRLKAYYGLAEAFVFSSKVESQGLVVLEAMQCGLPVVAIGKMGTREVMGGSNGGFMVDDDLDEFTAAVASLLEDPDLREQKRVEAKAHASKWTMRVQGQKMERFYQIVSRWKGIRG
jgi:glycosyltransferase involved in cell wall biosynthesis